MDQPWHPLLGVSPSWPLGGGRVTLAVPIKVGFSLSDYYELEGQDNNFGFFDIGGLLTIPLTAVGSQFGNWNFHAGVDLLAFGETTEALNVDEDGDTSNNRVIGLFGIGCSY